MSDLGKSALTFYNDGFGVTRRKGLVKTKVDFLRWPLRRQLRISISISTKQKSKFFSYGKNFQTAQKL